jgi:hypothetical protein
VATQKLEERSKLVPLLYNDPKFFYYNGNPDNNRNGGGLGNFTQKKIKFGGDRRGSGDSGQPYITTPIPLRLAQSIADDGLVRGGIITADRASQIDTERINRFLKDKPRGPLFIQRQVKLQFSNPKLEVKKFRGSGDGLFGIVSSAAAGLFNVVNELIPGPTRLYNQGFNTIAQIGATAFGRHFDRHGLTPVQDDNTKYLAVAKHNNENGTNRLVELKTKLIKPVENPQKFLNSANFIINNINALFKTNIPTKGLQPQDLQIANYLGGPDSIYGNGRTIIRRFDITSNGFNTLEVQERIAPGVPSINYANDLGVSDQYLDLFGNFVANNISTQNPTNKPSQVDQSAVVYKSPSSKNYETLRTAVSKVTDKQKYNVIQQKQLSNPNFSAYLGGKKTLDVANRYDPNILSIVFKIINPFDQTEDNIVFSAYMSGFKDNFDATWNEYNYVGRSESFFTYGKFKRNINFNLDIPFFNKAELLDKYRALGQLASTTAGTYNGNGLLGGVLIKLYIGNHIKGEYGILNSISYEIPNETSWDIDARLAMLVKTSFSFTIIHNKLPEYKKDKGFYDYVNGALVTRTNTITNTPDSSDVDLIQYFSNDPKPPLPTTSTADALANIQYAELDRQSDLLQQQTRNLLRQGPPIVDTNNLLRTPTNGVGTGFNANAGNANQILGINNAVAQNRVQQQQLTNRLLRTSPF